MFNKNLELAGRLYKEKNIKLAKEEFKKWYINGTLNEKVEAAYYLEKIASIMNSPVYEIYSYFSFILAYGSTSFKGKAYVEFGYYYRNRKDSKKMMYFYNKALKYIYRDIKLLTEIANYYLSQNDPVMQSKAKHYFSKILSLNKEQANQDKFIRNENIAYFGIAKVLTKELKLEEAKEILQKIKIQNQRDKDELNKCYGNIALFEKNYPVALKFFQENLKSSNFKISQAAREKVGIIYALLGDFDKAIIALEPVAKEKTKGNYANLILGKIYYIQKEYYKSYAANLKASKAFDICKLYALRSAMRFDEKEAIKLGNEIVNNKDLLIKYRAYLLYLSKNYNIYFSNLDYCNLNDREEQIINPNIEKIYNRTIRIYNFDYGKELDINSLVQEDLENAILMSAPNYCGGYYDNYFIQSKNTELEKMYFIISTLKDTKQIIEIKIISEEQLKDFNNTSLFEAQMPLIKSLFK